LALYTAYKVEKCAPLVQRQTKTKNSLRIHHSTVSMVCTPTTIVNESVARQKVYPARVKLGVGFVGDGHSTAALQLPPPPPSSRAVI